MTWTYEKYDRENGKIIDCPANDVDGSITGNVVIGLKLYFDENPEFRISQGWIKHLQIYEQQVDEYTIEDCFSVIDKSEEIMVLEELMDGLRPKIGVIFG